MVRKFLIFMRDLARRFRSQMEILWAIALVALGYASLAPQLAPPTGIAGIELELDKAIHLGVYICYAACPWVIGNSMRRAWLSTALVAVLSLAFEIGQAFVPGRTCSWDDLVANALGVMLGVVIGRKIAAL